MPPPILVQVAREFDASPERVFDAWLNPDLVGRWMIGPALREETVLRIAVDPRAGGRFSFLVLRDGQEIDHVGEYLVLARPHRLVFTWGVAAIAEGDSRVTVNVGPRGRMHTRARARAPARVGRVRRKHPRRLDSDVGLPGGDR
jgi:uncharacterized protein YndB with AHSA1/START domain